MKKFKCMNIGNCENANNGKEFEIAEGDEQVCPKCHSTMLVEVIDTNWKRIIGIVVGALVLIGIVVGLFLALGGSKKPEKVVLNQTSITLKVGASSQLSATLEPEGSESEVEWVSSDAGVVSVSADGTLTAVKEGTAKIMAKAVANEKARAMCDVTVEAAEVAAENTDDVQTTSTKDNAAQEGQAVGGSKGGSSSGGSSVGTSGGGQNPSWGVYTGGRQNGKPHGNGVLRITKPHSINGQMAQPGERIEGVFRDGYVNMGTWFQKDGNAVVVKDVKVI